jgi:tRNA U34 5-methylaminomethyl-2-thiouridine-forming methyltransferase MnmC
MNPKAQQPKQNQGLSALKSNRISASELSLIFTTYKSHAAVRDFLQLNYALTPYQIDELLRGFRQAKSDREAMAHLYLHTGLSLREFLKAIFYSSVTSLAVYALASQIIKNTFPQHQDKIVAIIVISVATSATFITLLSLNSHEPKAIMNKLVDTAYPLQDQLDDKEVKVYTINIY